MEVNQNQRTINETQLPESRCIENGDTNGVVCGEGTSRSTSNSPLAPTQCDQPARRRSTGPRTNRGKIRSSQNAIKHGIFSKATLLKGESGSDYKSLHGALSESLEPVGKLEELLVDKAASLLWRQRRLLVAEGAEIQKPSERLELDLQREQLEEAEIISQRVHPAEPKSSIAVGLIWSIRNLKILERCLGLLDALQREVTAYGLDCDRDDPLLARLYGPIDKLHLRQTIYERYLIWCARIEAEEDKEKERREGKEDVLREIAEEISRLKQYQEKYNLVDSERRKVEILSHSVPDSRRLDSLLRYENNLDRSLDRILMQLERLQRIRKGQSVLPPIRLDVSS